MFNKSFKDMRAVNLDDYLKKRDGADYLNWADCKALLHQHGAETVHFEPVVGANGSSLIYSDVEFSNGKDGKDNRKNRCYETRIKVVIDSLVFEMQVPVMNGANAVQDNSMSQQRLWNAQTRAFVKGVAIHTGLGFDLWCKSEQADEEQFYKKEEDIEVHRIMKIRERILAQITELLKLGKDSTEIAAIAGYEDEAEFQLFLKKDFARINNVEAHLRKAIKDHDSK